jgi:hypothetical protein
MSLKYKYSLLIITALLYTAILHAQTTNPPGFVEDVTDLVPLEGGLFYLLAAALGYGSRKLFERTKRDSSFK